MDRVLKGPVTLKIVTNASDSQFLCLHKNKNITLKYVHVRLFTVDT
jgi:hypothetical protein